MQLALARIGAETVEEALALWEGVNPSRMASTAARWLGEAITMIMTRREHSRNLAFAYYRLVRALRTGTTVADPFEPSSRYVTLEVLRREFAELAGVEGDLEYDDDVDELGDEPGPVDEVVVELADSADSGGSAGDDPDQVLVEEIEGLRREEERLEREAEREAEIVLRALGPDNLESKLDDEIAELKAREADALRDEAHRQAGMRQAAAAERLVLNGTRDHLDTAADKDPKAIGYVRLSRTGTPCGWCAMLIARGPVYKSGRSAEYSEGTAYHDNDKCYSMPVFSRDEYNSSPLFHLNRKYAEEWPRVTKGLGGKDALSEWRRHIRAQKAKQAA